MSLSTIDSHTIENLYGTLMGATWLNTMLFACELYFTYLRLFENSGRESYYTQLGLVAILLIDGISSAAGYATVWQYTIKFWGEETILDTKLVSLKLTILATVLAQLAFHVFQIHHIRSIVQHRLARMGTLAMLPVALVPLIIIVRAWILTPGGYFNDAWLVSLFANAGTDIFFTAVVGVVLILNRHHSLVFGLENVSAGWRTFSSIIVCGALPTFIESLMVVLAYVLATSNITTALGLNVGRLFTLSLLFVIYRTSGEAELEATEAPSAPWNATGTIIDGIVVDVKTQHQVEINREAPLAAVKLGGLSEGMTPYSEKAAGTTTATKKAISRRDTFDEDDF